MTMRARTLRMVLGLGLLGYGCSSAAGEPQAGEAKGGSSGSGVGGGVSSGGAGGGAGASASGGSGGGVSSGALPTIAGCPIFPADDDWNTDISGKASDAGWTARLHALVGAANIHPDYGNSGDAHYGIPINVVSATQQMVGVTFDWWPEESDPGPYPLPAPDQVRIEGGTATNCDGDCHVLIVQQGSCRLYEGNACKYQADGWHCGNGAKWDATRPSYGQRTVGWTSADAAGLAITPGIIRYDEVVAGEIGHAIRFTVSCSTAHYVRPATHEAVPKGCDPNDPNAPPMGLRVRLRQDFDTSTFSPHAGVVLLAMKKYGMILADNGSNFYFQGEDNPGWTENDVEPLKDVPAQAFEVVEIPPHQP
jgi:hypothetical protein